jgi:outer membrane immunogenic protein
MSMRNILMAATVAAALAAPLAATAADLPRPNAMPTKAPPFVAPEFIWNGFYVGVNGGGGWGRAWSDQTGHFDTSGGVVGGTVGYNAQLGRWVLGFEGDIDWSNVGGSTANGCPAGNCSVQNNWLSTARGRVGYAFGSFLPYITGGLAVGDVNASVPGFTGMDATQVGWTAGVGLEYAINQRWSVKAEYLRVDLGRFDCGLSCGPTAPDNVSFRENLVRGGINLHF